MGRRGLWRLILSAAVLAAGCREEKKSGPDLSSPKAAAITFTRALEAGDLATARMASNASGFEGDLLEAMADSSSGMNRLTVIASARLGEEARKIAEQHAQINMTKVLSEGAVDIQGNRATLRSKDGGSVHLQKTDNQWRVDVGALSKGQDVSQVVTFLRAAGLAARQVADDIDAGRVKTITEAQDVMVARVAANLPRQMRARLIPPNPSTQPAATPST